MPNIREFSAPSDLGLRPDDRAGDSVASAGRRIASLYGQAADAINDQGRSAKGAVDAVGRVAVAYNDQRERGDIAAAATDRLATLDKDWSLTVNGNGLDPKDQNYLAPADPRDPSVAERFMKERVEPELEKLNSIPFGEAGQRFAAAKVDQIRNHLTEKLTADMSKRAGDAAVLNDRVTVNNLSNLVTTSPDFHSVDMALQQHNEAAVGWRANPNLSVAQRGALDLHFQQSQEQIVHAAAFSAIGKAADPEAVAASYSAKYPQYIKGDAVNQLAKAATVVQHANRVDQERAIRLQKQQQQEKSDQTEVQYLQKLESDDPKERAGVTARQIVLDPNMNRESKERLRALVNRELKPETDSRISQTTFVGLLRDLRAADVDPDTVMQKAWDARLTDPGKSGSMSEKDFNQFRTEVIARKTPEGAALEHDRALFFKQYAGAIAGRTYDPAVGSPKLYAAEVDARRTETMLRAKGLDPHLAYDPSSEYFIGKPARIQKYQGSMQGDLTDRAANPTAPPPAGADAKPEGRIETPYELRGVAALSYSKSRNMWRDDTTGELYDAAGKKVGK